VRAVGDEALSLPDILKKRGESSTVIAYDSSFVGTGNLGDKNFTMNSELDLLGKVGEEEKLTNPNSRRIIHKEGDESDTFNRDYLGFQALRSQVYKN